MLASWTHDIALHVPRVARRVRCQARAILTGRTWAQVRKNRVAMKTFVLSEVDPTDVPYLDAAREKQRRKTLARKLAAGTDAASMKAKRVREREVKAGKIPPCTTYAVFDPADVYAPELRAGWNAVWGLLGPELMCLCLLITGTVLSKPYTSAPAHGAHGHLLH